SSRANKGMRDILGRFGIGITAPGPKKYARSKRIRESGPLKFETLRLGPSFGGHPSNGKMQQRTNSIRDPIPPIISGSQLQVEVQAVVVGPLNAVDHAIEPQVKVIRTVDIGGETQAGKEN